ncbi:MAG: hypothetical protein QHH13_13280 [Melioribacter sp.]|uniref:MauE/DoxX family redox-associated membrane protein n=1 Tax=Rosettibacter primus TaxID=3111523 RepID=UPI00247E9E3C|nr:hypothetical protein [Melioribacter sp.]
MLNTNFTQKRNELIIIILRIILGIVFLFSAYSKLITPGIVEIILIDHGFFSSRETAAIFVRLLIGLEFSLGLLFVFNIEIKRVVIPASIIFLVVFTIYLIYTGYFLKDNQNCGCFGEVIPMSPLESIIKNVFLVIMIFVLSKYKIMNKNNLMLTFLIIIVVSVLMFAASPVKSYRNFKFSDLTYFEGKGRVDLTSGDKFIAVMNTECEHCQQLAIELETLRTKPEVYSNIFSLLFSEGDVSIDSFKVITKFNLPYQKIDVKKFYDLIGSSPPRIYWLHDGEVKEFWDNNFLENILKTQIK